MILLLGGTAETNAIATLLANEGRKVLVSTATNAPLRITGSSVERRSGPLDRDGMCALIRERGILAIVDATHPYAAQVSATAREVAELAGVPCFSYVRPPALEDDADVLVAEDHDEAARLAFSFGKPVLLTTGTRNLEPYVTASREAGISLVARVLSVPASIEACRQAGLPPEKIISARGPFSIEENIRVIRRHAIGVLVTKDGGVTGGLPQKIEAARREGCRVVLVARPKGYAQAFGDIDALVQAVLSSV